MKLCAFPMRFIKQYLPYYKNNLKIALPIVLTQLGGAVVSLADNIMVGHVGTTELAAVSFSSSIYFLGHVLAIGAVMGITPLVGQVFVQKDKHNIKSYFYNGFLFSLIVAIALTGLLFSVYPFLDKMGQETEVVETCRPYYLITTFSLIPFLLFCHFKQFMEGLGNTKIAMIITIIANCINIFLNYLLIFGKWGFPKYGIIGAGIATFIARLLMPIMFIAIIRLKNQWWQYIKQFSIHLLSRQRLAKIAQIGIPIGGHMLLECSVWCLSAIMVGWLGEVPLAANQIALQVANTTFMIVIGIGNAATIRVSHRLGERKFKELKMAANAATHLCILNNAITTILIIAFSRQLPHIFTTDPTVIEAAIPLLILAGIFQIFDGIQCIGIGILRGLTDVRIPVIYAFITYIVINLPLGYLLAFPIQMGASGIWVAFSISLCMAAILYHVRWRRKWNSLSKTYDQTSPLGIF